MSHLPSLLLPLLRLHPGQFHTPRSELALSIVSPVPAWRWMPCSPWCVLADQGQLFPHPCCFLPASPHLPHSLILTESSSVPFLLFSPHFLACDASREAEKPQVLLLLPSLPGEARAESCTSFSSSTSVCPAGNSQAWSGHSSREQKCPKPALDVPCQQPPSIPIRWVMSPAALGALWHFWR